MKDDSIRSCLFIYNKRGQILNKKSGWVPMGTILRQPKGLYTIKGKKYYYFGKGLFFPKSGTEPYRIPKKHINTAFCIKLIIK